MVTACDKCRRPIKGKQATKVLDAELCDGCVNHIKSWLDKPQGLLSTLASALGGTQ